MRRAIIFLCAALTLGVIRPAHAQYAQYDEDRQQPKQYTDEDSQPVRIIAYALAPIGFALEWGVARPLHYVASNTFLSPVFNGDVREPRFRPPAIAEIPLDDVGDEPEKPAETWLGSNALPTQSAPAQAPQPSVLRPSLGGGANFNGGQPVLH